MNHVFYTFSVFWMIARPLTGTSPKYMHIVIVIPVHVSVIGFTKVRAAWSVSLQFQNGRRRDPCRFASSRNVRD